MRDVEAEGPAGRLTLTKADANFRALQTQLAEIEDQIQSARRYYNATVRDLNSRIESIPDSLIARPFGFTEEPFLDLGEAGLAQPPKIDFGAAGG